MMRVRFLLLIPLLLIGTALPAVAVAEPESPASPDHAVITELQVAGSTASDEFVELYNPLDTWLDVEGWQVEKASAVVDEPSDWQPLFTFSEAERWLAAGSHFLLCSQSSTLTDCDGTFSLNLAGTGGHVRLVRPDMSTTDEADFLVVDLLGWGSANQPEATSAPAPAANKSLSRTISTEGQYQDRDNNSQDFAVTVTPSPEAALPLDPDNPPPVEPEPEPEPEPNPEPGPEPVEYADLVINEVLPDPVAPQTDAEDEFIELYNPSSSTVSLTGYTLQTGSSLQYRYEIPSGTIAGRGYKAFYARTTNLTLSNSGSRVQLLAPGGDVAATLVTYDESEAGESWARFSSRFDWTDRATPGAANIAHSPEVAKTSNTSSSKTSQVKKSYARVAITEILPDPAAPQKDADDEFVELYNPNGFAVSLDGYRIKSGSTLRSSAVLDGLTIRPRSYIAVFNKDVNLSLSNKGGRVILNDPNKQEISHITSYPEAKEGQSWALIGGVWQWTGKPTPAAKNIAQAAMSQNSADSPRAGASNGGSINGILGNLSQPAALPITPPNWRLLGGVGAAAFAYILYESRHDVRNWVYRWRRYQETKQASK